MDKLKQWVALTALGAVAILALGWFLLISPKHSQASDLKTQAAAQLSTNAGLQAQLAQLKAQAKDLPAQQAKIAAVAAKIPDNPAQASLARQLQKAADDASVDLVSINAGQPTATTGGLQSMDYSLSVAGGYFQVEQFLSKIETLTRAAKVSALALIPGADAGAKTTTDASKITKGSALVASVTVRVFDSGVATGTTAATTGAAATTPTTPTTPTTSTGTAATTSTTKAQ